MPEPKLDLNLGENTPTDDGQSDETITEEDYAEIAEDDSVTLSKEEYDKILGERDNYKRGLLSYKEKVRTQPKEEKREDVPVVKTTATEQEAIGKFIEDNPEAEDIWLEIIKYYSGSRGKDKSDNIIKDLDDAWTLYLKHNPPKDKGDNAAMAELSKEKSLSSTTGGGGKPQKGGIIPKKTNLSEWYKE